MATQVWAAYVSGLLSGLFALLGFWLNSRNEQQRRRAVELREDLLWFRNALAEAYSQGIYYLFKLSESADAVPRIEKDVRQHRSESQRYLLLLHAYHAPEETKQRLLVSVDDLDHATDNLGPAARAGLMLVRELFKKDPRLNVRQ